MFIIIQIPISNYISLSLAKNESFKNISETRFIKKISENCLISQWKNIDETI